MSFDEFYDFYKNKNLLRDKCNENKCTLKNISKDKFIILNGDKIASFYSPNQTPKSADCILISKKPIKDNKYAIIICELGKNKNFEDVKIKLYNSGNYIYEKFKEYNLKINKIECIFLGQYKNRPKQTKRAFAIGNFHNVKIRRENCGFDFEKLN